MDVPRQIWPDDGELKNRSVELPRAAVWIGARMALIGRAPRKARSARSAAMRRQSEPLGEVALASPPSVARGDVGDISRKFRGRIFGVLGFLNLDDRHFCAGLSATLATGPKMLYVTRADVVNCILSPALISGRAGFFLGGDRQLGGSRAAASEVLVARLAASHLSRSGR